MRSFAFKLRLCKLGLLAAGPVLQTTNLQLTQAKKLSLNRKQQLALKKMFLTADDQRRREMAAGCGGIDRDALCQKHYEKLAGRQVYVRHPYNREAYSFTKEDKSDSKPVETGAVVEVVSGRDFLLPGHPNVAPVVIDGSPEIRYINSCYLTLQAPDYHLRLLWQAEPYRVGALRLKENEYYYIENLETPEFNPDGRVKNLDPDTGDTVQNYTRVRLLDRGAVKNFATVEEVTGEKKTYVVRPWDLTKNPAVLLEYSRKAPDYALRLQAKEYEKPDLMGLKENEYYYIESLENLDINQGCVIGFDPNTPRTTSRVRLLRVEMRFVEGKSQKESVALVKEDTTDGKKYWVKPWDLTKFPAVAVCRERRQKMYNSRDDYRVHFQRLCGPCEKVYVRPVDPNAEVYSYGDPYDIAKKERVVTNPGEGFLVEVVSTMQNAGDLFPVRFTGSGGIRWINGCHLTTYKSPQPGLLRAEHCEGERKKMYEDYEASSAAYKEHFKELSGRTAYVKPVSAREVVYSYKDGKKEDPKKVENGSSVEVVSQEDTPELGDLFPVVINGQIRYINGCHLTIHQ